MSAGVPKAMASYYVECYRKLKEELGQELAYKIIIAMAGRNGS